MLSKERHQTATGPERYDVTLSVPGLRDDPEFNCAIGRTGRVVFDVRPLDWIRDAF